MKIASAAAILAAIALLSVSGSPHAYATDMDDFRWDHHRADCRIIEIRTTNRWGDDVSVRRRVCG
jgi:hypothetical protein